MGGSELAMVQRLLGFDRGLGEIAEGHGFLAVPSQIQVGVDVGQQRSDGRDQIPQLSVGRDAEKALSDNVVACRPPPHEWPQRGEFGGRILRGRGRYLVVHKEIMPR